VRTKCSLIAVVMCLSTCATTPRDHEVLEPATDRLLKHLTTLAFTLHIAAGALALGAGTIAVCVRKGGRLHRAAGSVFSGAMVVMAVFASYLAVAMPDQLANLFIGSFTLYLVATAWLAARRADGRSGVYDKIALGVSVVLCAPFAILSVQLAFGLEPLVESAVPFEGAVLIAIYVLTAVLLAAVIGDARVVVAGGISGAPRIARHLWRMCLALTLATGSAFTNGFARLLPGPYHVPVSFFLPQFLPLALLIFWLVRVRFTGWFERQRLGRPPA
jgi:hypothetical protein